MGERGPKGRFSNVSCTNRECRKYGVTGEENIVSNGTCRSRGDTVQRFFCKECKHYFNANTDTAYDGLRTDTDRIEYALKCLNDGMGIRATARTVGVTPNTVQRWRRRAADQSAAVSESFEKELAPESVQFDEMMGVVKKT